MTHTLHRRGTVESLEHDYTMFNNVQQGINNINVGERAATFLKIMVKNKPVNAGYRWIGSLSAGVPLEDIVNEREKQSNIFSCNAVFDSKDKLVETLKELKEKELGLCVIVGGLLKEVFDAANKAGLTPHTVNIPLGIWGKKELLPKEKVLWITTMCGHNMVPPQLVNSIIEQIKRGSISLEDASKILSKPCICGAFNPKRAEEVLKELIKE